jgi:hypothetical protein
MKALGWVLALLAGAVATGEFYLFQSQKAEALAAQAADYEAKLAAQKAAADAAMKKVADDATAAAQVMQTELDFAKMPELPLKTQFRPGQVLYIENESDADVSCKVRMTRPIGAVTKDFDFSMKSRTFKDIAAMEEWIFQRGDKIEFLKPGFKPRELIVP